MNLVQKVARGRVTGGLVAMLACLSWPAPLRAEPIRYLAEAHVTASEYKVLCFGCPTNTQTELISASNGGPGSTSASHGYDAPGKVAVSARASFDPTQNDLPVLKARATAEIFFDPPPPSPLTVVYEYTAGATARGMNLFTYHGTSPERTS